MSYVTKILSRLFQFLEIHVHVFYMQMMDLCSSFLKKVNSEWQLILVTFSLFQKCIVTCQSKTRILLLCFWFDCWDFFGDWTTDTFKTTMIFWRWILSNSKRPDTPVTNTLLIFAAYIGYKTLARVPSFSTLVTWEKMYLCKQTDDLQHKSFCSCSLLSVSSEISITSWSEKCCQLLSLYADSMQNWSLWKKELIALKKKKLS